MKRTVILVAALTTAASSAQAGGFEQVNQSAAAAGVANAFAATANDASALAYNPAGIAWLREGVNVTGGITMNYRNSSLKSATGVFSNTGTEPTAAYIYAAWTPRNGNLAAGFGFSPLYQVNNSWMDAFPATGGISKITVDHTMADVVYALNSDLALGMGADWYFTRATMSQGGSNFKGSDIGSFGGHASLLWKPLPEWSLGLVYRSGSKVKAKGQGSSLSFKLPDQATAAIAYNITDVLRFETDVKWSRWSVLKDMNVTGAVTQTNALNLRDTLTAMAGLTWTWRENVQVRMGYAYEQGANRTLNYNPVIADQDGHRITLGGGGDLMGVHADLATQYVFYSKKTATGAYAGEYRDRRMAIALTVSKHFD